MQRSFATSDVLVIITDDIRESDGMLGSSFTQLWLFVKLGKLAIWAGGARRWPIVQLVSLLLSRVSPSKQLLVPFLRVLRRVRNIQQLRSNATWNESANKFLK